MRLAIVDFFAKSIAALACCVGLSTAFSEENLESTRSAADLVNQALQHGADGESSQREQLLQEALQRSPESAPARWHTGHVMLRDEWLTHEEVAKRAANNMSLVNYRRVRPTYAETIDDQLALAAWCAQQELPDQQRVHLTLDAEVDDRVVGVERRLQQHARDVRGDIDQAAKRAVQMQIRGMHETEH